MRRLFWLGLGLAAGVVVVRQLTRTAESYSPQGIAQSLSASFASLAETAREFAAEVQAGMAEREAQLSAALSADADPSVVFDGEPGGDR